MITFSGKIKKKDINSCQYAVKKTNRAVKRKQMRLVMNELNHAPAPYRLGLAAFLALFLVSGCAEVRYDTNVKTSTVSQGGVQSVAGQSDNATASYNAGKDEGRTVSSPGKYDGVTANYSLRPGGNAKQSVATRSQAAPEERADYVPVVLDAGVVLFEFDKWVIKESYFAELDRWVEFLQMNRLMTAEIYGHTDNKGTSKYNQRLSEKRAQAVINYLVKNGVAAKRLTARGVGESQPVAPNSNEDGRHKNRRVGAEAKY